MKNIIIGCASFLVLGAVAGCERKPTDPGNIPPGTEVGMLRVYLGSDTPTNQLDPRVDEVWVRIDSVEARHEDEGWVTVSEERQDFDLLGGHGGGMDDDGADDGGAGGGADDGGAGGGLGGNNAVGGGAEGGGAGGVDEGGVSFGGMMAELIGEGDVWTGAYDRLHLGIADAWILIDGAQQDLEFMGNIDPLDPFEAGLTVNESFFVDRESVTSLRIVWDLGDNLQERDNGAWALGADTRVEVDIAEGGGEAGGGND